MPKTITTTTTLYEFKELSPAAKEKAREWWRDGEQMYFYPLDSDWIETAANLLGITFDTNTVKLMSGKTRDEPRIYWQLDGQGSGASFAGTYEYKEDAYHKIKEECPQDEKLHEIALELFRIQSANNHELTCSIKHDGRNSHKYSMDIDTFKDGNDADLDAKSTMVLIMRDFADWIYKVIQAEYDYRMSDDCADDSIEANDYTFTKDGEREC